MTPAQWALFWQVRVVGLAGASGSSLVEIRPMRHARLASPHARVLVATLALWMGAACFGQGTSPKPTPFTKEVESHFDAWDRNHDGTLEADEVDVLVVDTDLKGGAAAA